MIKTFHVYLTYLIIFFNISLFAQEKDNLLKIGLLAPLSGKYEKNRVLDTFCNSNGS